MPILLNFFISTPFKMADHGATAPSPSPQPDLTRNRLPTLFEVLSRRTLPPVDLFSFYIYMRDQQRSVDYLDFWSARLPPTIDAFAFTDFFAGSMLHSTCRSAATMCASFVAQCS